MDDSRDDDAVETLRLEFLKNSGFPYDDGPIVVAGNDIFDYRHARGMAMKKKKKRRRKKDLLTSWISSEWTSGGQTHPADDATPSDPTDTMEEVTFTASTSSIGARSQNESLLDLDRHFSHHSAIRDFNETMPVLIPAPFHPRRGIVVPSYPEERLRTLALEEERLRREQNDSTDTNNQNEKI